MLANSQPVSQSVQSVSATHPVSTGHRGALLSISQSLCHRDPGPQQHNLVSCRVSTSQPLVPFSLFQSRRQRVNASMRQQQREHVRGDSPDLLHSPPPLPHTAAIASTHRIIEMWNGKVWTEKGESLQIRLRACAHAHAHRSVGTGVGVGNNRTRDPPVWRLFQPLPLLPSPPLGSPHTHQAAQRALCRVRIRVLSFAGRRSIRKGSPLQKRRWVAISICAKNQNTKTRY